MTKKEMINKMMEYGYGIHTKYDFEWFMCYTDKEIERMYQKFITYKNEKKLKKVSKKG